MGKKKSQFRKKLFFILSLFFVLLVFLLGVEVGQRFSGMSLKSQKKGVEKRFLTGNEQGGREVTEAMDNSSDEVEPEPKITFYDDLQGESREHETVPNSDSSGERLHRNEGVRKESSSPSNEDSNLSPPPSKYALQLGSYKTRYQAEELESEMKKKGYSTYIHEVDIPEKGKCYRVKIGDYDNLEQVRQAAEDFQKKEGKSAIITSVLP